MNFSFQLMSLTALSLAFECTAWIGRKYFEIAMRRAVAQYNCICSSTCVGPIEMQLKSQRRAEANAHSMHFTLCRPAAAAEPQN